MLSSRLRRLLFEPFYYWRNNSPKLAYWKKLEETQYLSLEALKDIQLKRLQKLFAYLWEQNQFYRTRFQKAGLNQESLKTVSDITKIPILTKREIRDNGSCMISNGFDKKSLLHFKTGGSTGKALDIFLLKNAVNFVMHVQEGMIAGLVGNLVRQSEQPGEIQSCP
jgi:phenylacetate-CoA ligase